MYIDFLQEKAIAYVFGEADCLYLSHWRNTMSWIEDLLIIAGLLLDLFAAMACHGALVAKINKKG